MRQPPSPVRHHFSHELVLLLDLVKTDDAFRVSNLKLNSAGAVEGP